MPLLVFALSLPLVASGASPEREYKRVLLHGGTYLEYALVRPPEFRASEPSPVLLAFPSGIQDKTEVERTLDRYGAALAQRGWVVASPVAPTGKTFHEGAETWIPALLNQLARDVRVEGGKFHVAGVESGALSAFRVALEFPERFASLTVTPGRVPKGWDFEKLGLLKYVAVTVYARDDDAGASRSLVDEMRKRGVRASLEALPATGEGLSPERLAAALEKERTPTNVEDEVIRALVDLHDAASKADEERYFSRFAPGAVFLGTDATERWTVDEFHDWVRRGDYFASGRGWTYVPSQQHVMVSPDGNTAWFDERLENAKIGTCRGTGVLLRTADGWKIAQYNLSVPVPNELMAEVVQLIQKRAGPK